VFLLEKGKRGEKEAGLDSAIAGEGKSRLYTVKRRFDGFLVF
jgi:hypothetical protein